MVARCRGGVNCLHMYSGVSEYLTAEYIGISVRIEKNINIE